MSGGLRQDALAIAAKHVADNRPGMGVHRGPLPDESLTFPCVECDMDWPCDVVLMGRIVATLPSTGEYNAVSEDRDMWRRLTGEAQAEAGTVVTNTMTWPDGSETVDEFRLNQPVAEERHG